MYAAEALTIHTLKTKPVDLFGDDILYLPSPYPTHPVSHLPYHACKSCLGDIDLVFSGECVMMLCSASPRAPMCDR